MNRWLRLGTAAVLLALAGFILATRFKFETSLSDFLPARADTTEGRPSDLKIAQALTNSAASRRMVVVVRGPETVALRARDDIAAVLAGQPGVSRVSSGPEGDFDAAIHELYHPRKYAFATDASDEVANARYTPEAMNQAADDLLGHLSTAAAPLYSRMAPTDPLLLFPAHLERLEAASGKLNVANGSLVDADGGLILFVELADSAFDSEKQKPIVDAYESERARLLEASQGLTPKLTPKLTIEAAGASRFAVAAERAIRRDVQRVSTLSLLLVLGIFLAVFRSIRDLFLAMTPIACGFLAATAVTTLAFGAIHGLTLAFGGALVGVAIDYPIHLLTHARFHEGKTTLEKAVRTVWPGLLLAAGTTIAGLAGLAWTTFPGLQQVAVFSTTGVVAAVLATRYLMPALSTRPPSKPGAVLRAIGRASAAVLRVFSNRRSLGVTLAIGAAALALIGIPRLEWQSDLKKLNPSFPRLEAEDVSVRAAVTDTEAGHFVVALGETWEDALSSNDAAFNQLQTAVRDEKLSGFQSLHPLLWSSKLQQRNWNVLRENPDAAAHLKQALDERGFATEPFAPGLAEMASPPPFDALTIEGMLATPVGDLVQPFLVDIDGKKAVLSYLGPVSDPDAVDALIADIPGTFRFDQKSSLSSAYGLYRVRTSQLVAVGLFLVVLVTWLRYRRVRPTIAACVPAMLASAATLGTLGILGIPVHLLHMLGLLLVVSMGVDYGVFLVEHGMRGQGDRSGVTAAMSSIVLACISTMASFGALSLSGVPALQALGLTVALGVPASLILAPAVLGAVRGSAKTRSDAMVSTEVEQT